MIKEKTATWIGHRECYGLTEERVIKEIEGLIEKGYMIFLCGGMGNFDSLCARCVHKLKKRFANIQCVLVIPYLTFQNYNREYYDEILYPDGFEKYYFKKAIEKNRFLVDSSSAAVCYVEHRFGGAYKTYIYAKKQGLALVNLGCMAEESLCFPMA